MKKLGTGIFLTLFLLLSFGVAGASTLTFEGLSNGDLSYYEGFTWANATVFDEALSLELDYDEIDPSTVTFMSLNSGFSVTSADFLFTSTNTTSTSSLSIIVSDLTNHVGVDLSAGTAKLDVDLSIFTNITRLYFGINKNNADDIQRITVDNIVYTLNGDTVPEPATMILFGLGMLGIAGTARKKMSA